MVLAGALDHVLPGREDLRLAFAWCSCQCRSSTCPYVMRVGCSCCQIGRRGAWDVEGSGCPVVQPKLGVTEMRRQCGGSSAARQDATAPIITYRKVPPLYIPTPVNGALKQVGGV